MTKLLAKLGWCTLLVALLGAFTTTASARERQKFSFTKNAREMISETRMSPGDIAGRELVRYGYIDRINFSRGLDLMEERGFNQDDQIAGTGKHSGVAVDVLDTGDQIYQIYEGTHETATKEGGDWEVTYQGTMKFIGGTGKYKNATGNGTYKGRITPNSFQEQDEGEVEY